MGGSWHASPQFPPSFPPKLMSDLLFVGLASTQLPLPLSTKTNVPNSPSLGLLYLF